MQSNGDGYVDAGKRALVIGYGDVGKGSAQSLRQEGMIVESQRSIQSAPCRPAWTAMSVSAYQGGINTGKVEDIDKRLLQDTDLLVTCTGNTKRATPPSSARSRRNCRGLQCWSLRQRDDTAFMREHWRWDEVKEQVRVHRSGDDYLILLSEGRLVNLGNAMGHPSRIMDSSFESGACADVSL